MKLAFLFLFLATTANAACYPHPNLILCWETQEGLGAFTQDSSLSKLNGTFNGGPAWVRASKPQVFGNTADTMTTVNMGDNAISFADSPGIEVVTPATSIFDFSSNRPYIISFSFQAPALPIAQNETILGYTDGLTGVGWSTHMNTAGQFVMCHIAAANSVAGPAVTDRNPHRMMVIRNVGNLWRFLDGNPYAAQSGFGDMITLLGGLCGLSRTSISAAGIWSGKAGNVAIYNFSPDNFAAAKAFAQNEYLYWQGGGGE